MHIQLLPKLNQNALLTCCFLCGSWASSFAMWCAELPTLLPVVELAEVLLHVQNGAWLLCRVVANTPDSFYEGMNLGGLCHWSLCNL